MVNVYVAGSPYWSRLKEAMCGEVSNRLEGIGDYGLAEAINPDILHSHKKTY